MNTEELYNYLYEYFEYRGGKFYYKKLNKYNTAKELNQEVGGIGVNGYWRVKIKGKYHALHRLIYLYHKKELPKIVDHIDRNKNNNKIENLRSVNIYESLHNRGKHKRNKSGYKGVSYRQKTNNWRATIRIKGKFIEIGRYSTSELAYQAYCEFVKNNLKVYAL
jgi:hypothetical protein